MISRAQTMDKYKLGMILFLTSEAIFFGLLIFSYVFYRNQFAETGATPEVLNVPLGAILAVILFSSSLTIWLSERRLRRGDHRGMRLWLLVTVALGAIFLAGQGYEFAQLIAEGVALDNGLFGSTFFTVTGFHGFHVFVGLVALGIILLLARDIRGPHSSALESASLYWHFVDGVWVVVFSVIYIWSALLV